MGSVRGQATSVQAAVRMPLLRARPNAVLCAAVLWSCSAPHLPSLPCIFQRPPPCRALPAARIAGPSGSPDADVDEAELKPRAGKPSAKVRNSIAPCENCEVKKAIAAAASAMGTAVAVVARPGTSTLTPAASTSNVKVREFVLEGAGEWVFTVRHVWQNSMRSMRLVMLGG